MNAVLKTLPLEKYLERADEFAQDVVNAWGQNVQAGNGTLLSDDFKDVLEKACKYRDAKKIADNRRQFARLSEIESDAEQSTRQDFAGAYKAFRERHDT